MQCALAPDNCRTGSYKNEYACNRSHKRLRRKGHTRNHHNPDHTTRGLDSKPPDNYAELVLIKMNMPATEARNICIKKATHGIMITQITQPKGLTVNQ